ncbi:MAG: DUF4276 family protein [Prevotellaceae bacterium]|nr:DUF4276 family protein [Prevotellaceae bacterium]
MSPQTAPSKRLLADLNGYDKIIHRSCIRNELGLQNIRNKCPRFNAWIENLEKI